jgi:hypothetical protein
VICLYVDPSKVSSECRARSLDQKKGHEASVVAGLTYNLENPDTDYQNGVSSHLDWGASQFLSEKAQVGLVGYIYYQIGGDSGSGARLGRATRRL